MSYYLVGIGGTGAKCIEAVIHLCAIGMFPKENLYCIFVDPDRSNGNLERAIVAIKQYRACSEIPIGYHESLRIFRTNIHIGDPPTWSPSMDKQVPNLADSFDYGILRAKNPRAAELFDVLYSDVQKATALEMGFRGHSSIGAAMMARIVKLCQVEPWLTFRKMIAADANAGQEAKIFLFGSIFGGTGASGFVSIPRLIRHELNRHEEKCIKTGSALLMPYFLFIPPYQRDELRTVSENFLMNTQVALQYYNSLQKEQDIVYLIGDSSPSPVRFSIGSSQQRNEAHFIELYAALAAYDFFTRQNAKGYAMIARETKEVLRWLDLPDGYNGFTIKSLFSQFTRFAFAYLGIFLPAIEDIRVNGKAYRAPWYIDYLEGNKNNSMKIETEMQFAQVMEYCKSFLLWIAQIVTSAKAQNIELINHLPFAEEKRTEEGSFVQLLGSFRESEFSNLVFPRTPPRPHELSTIWERMCSIRVSDSIAIGTGKFFHALYKACE